MIRRLLLDQGNLEKTAIIEEDREVSYRLLLQKALVVQSLLPANEKENIAILLPNGSDFIAAFWGVLMAGYTAFPLNDSLTVYEMLPLLRHARVSTVITTGAYRHSFEELTEPLAHDLCIVPMDALLKSTGGEPFADVDPSDAMVLLNTSGTTGKCKIVQLSEKNVAASVLGYLDKMRFDEAGEAHARYILAAPFSSVYGLMILSACLMRSFPIILVPPPFTLDALFQTAEKHGATHYEGSVSPILLMERLAGRPIPYDIGKFTCFGFGGSKVSGRTIETVQNTYKGVELWQGYGMTEASPLITKHPRGKLTKPESVGTAINGMEIYVETENGIEDAPNTVGEIVVRGPNVMLGYYRNESETERALQNGFLHTGDIGYLDDQGYLYICGRKKNMILSRGYNVYPEEVEACLLGCPLVRDCRVYGQADGFGNETICADIVLVCPQTDIEFIGAYCQRRLADYKRPQKIFICESIPKNTLDKTVR